MKWPPAALVGQPDSDCWKSFTRCEECRFKLRGVYDSIVISFRLAQPTKLEIGRTSLAIFAGAVGLGPLKIFHLTVGEEEGHCGDKFKGVPRAYPCCQGGTNN